MKISDSERLILLMLCNIQEGLKIKGEFDPKFVSSAIMNGHSWAIKRQYLGAFPEGDDTPALVSEVEGILDMWSIVEGSYAALSPADKKLVEDGVPHFGKNPTFKGFDGNNESEHLSVCRFLVEEMDLWSEFKGRVVNSHMQVLPGYQRMMSVFNPLRSSLHTGHLAAQQIVAILKGIPYPEM